jgi:hypothetical protein
VLPLHRIAGRTDATVLHGADLDRFVSGARPLTDAEVHDADPAV